MPVQGAGHRIENPATGEPIARIPSLDAGEVSALVAAGRAAQPSWEALGFAGRAAVMRAARGWLVRNRRRMIDVIVAETGKPHEDAQTTELMVVADALGFWARRAPRYLRERRVRAHSPLFIGRRLSVSYRPMGVVGVIGPWNYPLINCFGDAVPALMAGNAVVLKPSEVTPLTSLLMAEGMRGAGLPDGVLGVATGDGATGAALVDHADMVMFTGSTATGREVMGRAARTLTPVSLELGGKDPMIVLRDADLERAANAALYYGMSNGGQMCVSVERVFVEEPVHDEFVRRLVAQAEALRQGPPDGPGSVEVGAVTHGPQLAVIERHVADARARGARVALGGEVLEGPGRFFAPTVLTGVDPSMAVMSEETFGPVLPVMSVRDAEHALELANASRYGLAASVWTRNLERGAELARRISAGSASVNDGPLGYAAPELPFGGMGDSGMGVRHGPEGIRKYCRTQSLLVTRRAPARELHYFPYSRGRTKLIERAMTLMYGRGR